MTAASSRFPLPAVARRPRDLWAVATAVGASVVFHLVLLWRFPVFVDEARFALDTYRGYHDPAQRFASLAEGQHPLLPWLGMLLMKVGFGPLTSIRLVSLVASAAIVILATAVGRRLGGPSVGSVSALLAAGLPFLVVYGSLGLYDLPLAALAAAAFLLALRHAERPSTGRALALGSVLGLALLLKLTAVVALGLVPLSVVLVGRRKGELLRWLSGLALAALVAACAYGILALSPYWQELSRIRAENFATHSLGVGVRHPLRWIDGNGPAYARSLAWYVTLPVLVAAAAGVALAVRRRSAVGALLVVWTLVPLTVALLLADAPFPRWLLLAVPFLLPLSALALVEVGRRGRAWTAVAAVVVSAGMALPDARVVFDPAAASYPSLDRAAFATGWAAGGPWKAAVAAVRARVGGVGATVAADRRSAAVPFLLLLDEPKDVVVQSDNPDALNATFAFDNGFGLPPRGDSTTWKKLDAWPRPGGGTPLALYARVGFLQGQVYDRADAFRSALGLSDSRFDAYLAARPNVRAWYELWFAAPH